MTNELPVFYSGIINELLNFSQDEKKRTQLSVYVSSLLTKLDQGEQDFFGDDRNLINKLMASSSHHKVKQKDLDTISRSITNLRIIDSFQIPAMLVSFPPANRQTYFGRYERLKSWTLLAALRMSCVGDYSNAIRRCARRVRHMSGDDYAWMLEIMPNFVDIKDSVQSLDVMRSENSDLTEAEKNKIADIHVLLRDFAEKRPPRNRKSSTGPNTTPPISPIINLNPVVVEPMPSLSEEGFEYEPIIPPTVHIPSVDPEEQSADQNTGQKTISIKIAEMDSLKQSVVQQAIQAKVIANRITVREMQLAAEWNVLTPYEVRTLMNYIWEPITKHNNIAALCLMLMLLTSRSQDRVISMLKQDNREADEYVLAKNGRSAFVYRIALPTPVTHPDALKLLCDKSDKHYLPLPDELAAPIINVLNIKGGPVFEELPEKIKEYVRNINKKSNLRLTPARVTGYLFSQLKHNCNDRADASLICGFSARQEPALYYYAPTIPHLFKEYVTYVRSLFDDAEINATYADKTSDEQRIGTQVIIDKLYVKTLFKAQHDFILNILESRETDIFLLHNEITLYVYQLLSLGTGHRPVTKPFESRQDIDLGRQQIWISDKELRSGLAARTIVLPRILCDQLRFYDDHLRVITKELRNTHHKIADSLDKALIGDAPYLQWISQNDAIGLEPNNINPQMESRWPMPLNWGRHFMRNALRDSGLTDEYVNAWMGHENFGEEAMGPWSGLSMNSLQITADKVQSIMGQLNILAIPGWSPRL